MNELKLDLNKNKNNKKELINFLSKIESKIDDKSIINVTLIKSDNLTPSEINNVFKNHTIFWNLNTDIEFDSNLTTDFNLKVDVPVSLIITAGNDNYLIIQNNLASGYFSEKDSAIVAAGIATSILRLST